MSNNLSAPQVSDNQAQKEITINDAVGRLDAAITNVKSYTVAAGFTVADDDFKSNMCLALGAGAVSAGFIVKVPATARGLFVVLNTSGQTATVEIDAQAVTAPTVATGAVALMFSDGVNVRKLA